MFPLLTFFSTLIGVFPVRCLKGQRQLQLLVWAVPLQLVHLALALYGLYSDLQSYTEEAEAYQKVIENPRIPVDSSKVASIQSWSVVRWLSDMSDAFSSVFGVILWMSKNSLAIVNRALSKCDHVNSSAVKFHVKYSCIIVAVFSLAPNLILGSYLHLMGFHHASLKLSFINLAKFFAEIVTENYFCLICSLLAAEIKGVRTSLEEMSTQGKEGAKEVLPSIDAPQKDLRLHEEAKRLRQHHLDIIQVVRDINSHFQTYIFICFFGSFLNPLTYWYIVLDKMFTGRAGQQPLLLINQLVFGMINISSSWVVCRGPQYLEDENAELALALEKLVLHASLPQTVRSEAYFFMRQCRCTEIQMDILGLFPLSTKRFFSVFMTVVSYLMVLWQFNVDDLAFVKPTDILENEDIYNYNSTA